MKELKVKRLLYSLFIIITLFLIGLYVWGICIGFIDFNPKMPYPPPTYAHGVALIGVPLEVTFVLIAVIILLFALTKWCINNHVDCKENK